MKLDISILVVDDTKFSSIVVGRTLKSAGYRDIRFASSAQDAILLHRQRPAQILIADWLMPNMDGLELSRFIRALDDKNQHFTYILLLTAKEGPEVVLDAFNHGIDDFINKIDIHKQLIPRIFAANRISTNYNNLLKQNTALVQQNKRLRGQLALSPNWQTQESS